MEREIKIHNHYTYDAFTDFAEFHCKKIQGVAYFRYMGLIMIGATMWFFLTSAELHWMNFIVNPGLWLSFLFIFVSYWIPGNTARQLYNKSKENNGLDNTIIFDADKVKFVSSEMEAVYFYKQLHRCYETEKYFFLYVRRSMAQIIRKEDFVQGTPEELRNFLDNEPKIKFVQKFQPHKTS